MLYCLISLHKLHLNADAPFTKDGKTACQRDVLREKTGRKLRHDSR